MSELETILKKHASMYPLMTPQDVVKLVYQNEFGVGHLIPDPAYALEYLLKELEEVDTNSEKRVEEIGNGLVRFYLSSLTRDEATKLVEAMVASANQIQGSKEVFLSKLEVVRLLCNEGCFSFTMADLESYLSEYIEDGIQPVSHSETYRATYTPHYRVILKEYCERIG